MSTRWMCTRAIVSGLAVACPFSAIRPPRPIRARHSSTAGPGRSITAEQMSWAAIPLTSWTMSISPASPMSVTWLSRPAMRITASGISAVSDRPVWRTRPASSAASMGSSLIPRSPRSSVRIGFCTSASLPLGDERGRGSLESGRAGGDAQPVRQSASSRCMLVIDSFSFRARFHGTMPAVPSGTATSLAARLSRSASSIGNRSCVVVLPSSTSGCEPVGSIAALTPVDPRPRGAGSSHPGLRSRWNGFIPVSPGQPPAGQRRTRKARVHPRFCVGLS